MNAARIAPWIGAALLAGGSANAAIVTQYTTLASTLNPALTAGTVMSGINAINMTAGSGLIANNGSTWNWRAWDVASDSFEDAVAANDYWTWGFTVADPITLDLTTMDIRLDRSGSGPDDFEIRASLNGGTAVSLLTHDYNDSDLGVNFTNVALNTFTGLVQGDSLVFTLAAFNSESTQGTFDLETITFPGGTDSLTIYGEVSANAVPLPAAAWLFGTAVLGLAGFARRRQAA